MPKDLLLVWLSHFSSSLSFSLSLLYRPPPLLSMPKEQDSLTFDMVDRILQLYRTAMAQDVVQVLSFSPNVQLA